jgi:hypothetical protein
MCLKYIKEGGKSYNRGTKNPGHTIIFISDDGRILLGHGSFLKQPPSRLPRRDAAQRLFVIFPEARMVHGHFGWVGRRKGQAVAVAFSTAPAPWHQQARRQPEKL